MSASGGLGLSSAAFVSASESLVLLRSLGHTVSTAESVTGGLIVAVLTSIPGASDVVRGGLAAYATDVKRDVLGVSSDVIDASGVVSSQTAEAMACSALSIFSSTWGVAVTGVAGPDRQAGIAVGTVFVTVAGPAAIPVGHHDAPVRSEQLSLSGDRDAIRAATVSAGLRLLAGCLASEAGKRSAG